jgi:hypothetical protein
MRGGGGALSDRFNRTIASGADHPSSGAVKSAKADFTLNIGKIRQAGFCGHLLPQGEKDYTAIGALIVLWAL